MIDVFEVEHAVTHQDDDARFPADTPDVDLIQGLAGDDPKPVLVTADINIRRRPVERQALAASGLTVVFLKARFHDLSFHQQAVKLLGVWPELVRQTTRVREPTAFEITAAAKKVTRLGPTQRL